MKTKDELFNGWTNKPTWLVKLWIDNEQGTQERASELLKDIDGIDAENVLKEYIETDLFPNTMPAFGLMIDLLNWSMVCVNWSEIVKAIKDEQ